MGANDVSVATYINNTVCSEKSCNFPIIFSDCILIVKCSWALDPQQAAYCFIFFISSVSQFLCLILSDRQGFGTRQDRQSRRRLKLLPQLSHKVGARSLFPPLSISDRPRLSQLVKIKWWGHNWCLYSSCSIHHISNHGKYTDSAVFLLRQFFFKSSKNANFGLILETVHRTVAFTHSVVSKEEQWPPRNGNRHNWAWAPGDLDHRQWLAGWTRSLFIYLLTLSITKCIVVESHALTCNWVLSRWSVLSTAWRRGSKVYFSKITVFFTVEPSLHLIIEKLYTRRAYADRQSQMGKNCQIWQPLSFTHFDTCQCKRVSNMMGVLGGRTNCLSFVSLFNIGWLVLDRGRVKFTNPKSVFNWIMKF